jgi:ribosomal protein L16 Arg81 hydroxylase
MSIARWLGNTSLSQFIVDYYLRIPYSNSAAPNDAREVGSWDVFERLLGEPHIDTMMARDGERVQTAVPQTSAELQTALANGCTILVRNAQKHDPALSKVAREIEQDLCGPVNIHMYATPAGHFGFGWHYDAEEVFIVQTEGQKEYSLRKNTVNPWPLEETLPADMHYEREIMPLMRCKLEPGDFLYIPCGYWHRAFARETSLSLAIGVMAPAAIDLLTRLRPLLINSLLWRQRLPIIERLEGDAKIQATQQYRAMLESLAADLQRTLTLKNLPIEDKCPTVLGSTGSPCDE